MLQGKASRNPTSPSSPAIDEDLAKDNELDGRVDSDEDSDEELEELLISHECEEAYRYAEEELYPICLKEILVGRYRVVHKLGWGRYSTIWMAQDLENKKMVALKIGISGDKGQQKGQQELVMQREILHTVKDKSRLLIFLDSFNLTSPKSTHQVIVFPVGGANQEYGMDKIPVKVRVRAAKELLLALESLHHADIIHCDLHSGSVVWDTGVIDDYTPKMIYETFCRPRSRNLRRLVKPWKKGDLDLPIKVDQGKLQGKIFLADFGLAIKSGTPVKRESKLQFPAIYCAPERLHGENPSFASDMWSYMCLFSELYFGVLLFRDASDAFIPSSLVQTLGPLPQQWAGKYDAAGTSQEYWYDQKQKPDSTMTLEEMTRRAVPDMSDGERKLILSIFSKGFTYLPEKRFTATELLQDEDFNAFMKIYEC